MPASFRLEFLGLTVTPVRVRGVNKGWMGCVTMQILVLRCMLASPKKITLIWVSGRLTTRSTRYGLRSIHPCLRDRRSERRP